MKHNIKPIQLKLDFNYIHTCHLMVEDISGGRHSVCQIASVTYFSGQQEYTVTFLDNSAAGILPAELLRAAVVFPGDPGTPEYKDKHSKKHHEVKLVFGDDPQLTAILIPIAEVREDLRDSKASVKSDDGALEMPVSEIHSVIWNPKHPTRYQVNRTDGMLFDSTVDALLEAGVIKPGDPGTPEWNPESYNPSRKHDNTPKTDPWDQIQEKSWDEFCGYGLLRFVNAFLHIFGWAIVLNKVGGVVTKVYPARVPFRGFAEKDMTRSYRQIARFMEENASEIRKEAEID